MKRYAPNEPCSKCGSREHRVAYRARSSDYDPERLVVTCACCGFSERRAPLDALRPDTFTAGVVIDGHVVVSVSGDTDSMGSVILRLTTAAAASEPPEDVYAPDSTGHYSPIITPRGFEA